MTTLRRQACVQFSDPTAPSGQEISTPSFLQKCRRAALARFRSRNAHLPGCRVIAYRVPPKPPCPDSTGMIVAHLSLAVCKAWEASRLGSPSEKRAHVEAQIHLALADMADQNIHGYLAVTDAQRDVFRPDFVQLANESLDRTTFSRLGLPADPHWEGTLVETVRPPSLILAISIDLAVARAGATMLARGA